jgi:hypothetical protein
VGPRHGIDELSGDTNAVTSPANATFQNVAHAKFAPDLADASRSSSP